MAAHATFSDWLDHRTKGEETLLTLLAGIVCLMGAILVVGLLLVLGALQWLGVPFVLLAILLCAVSLVGGTLLARMALRAQRSLGASDGHAPDGGLGAPAAGDGRATST